MVPEVDKRDTEAALRGLRTGIESVRQEILGWTLDKALTAHDAEAQALRKLAARSAQQTRQWTGRMLAELGSQYPYPNSSDSSTQIIDKTDVPVSTGLDLDPSWTVVQKIKHTRATLSKIKGELEGILQNCIPGSFFNQCLFEVQTNEIQTSMWLGELLAEFVVVPQAEPVVIASQNVVGALASGNDAAPTLSTTPDSLTANSSLGAESSPALNAVAMEAALSNPSQPELLTEVSSVTETLTSTSEQTGKNDEAVVSGESVSPSAENTTELMSVSGTSSEPGLQPKTDEPAHASDTEAAAATSPKKRRTADQPVNK